MTKPKAIITVSVLLLALSATLASNAWAAPEWNVGGAALVGEAALANTAVTDRETVLLVPGLNIDIGCLGNVGVTNGKIKQTNLILAEHLTYTRCLVFTPTTCSLESAEIPTNPVEGTTTKGEGTVDKVLFKPKSGKVFATFTLTGATCAISGEKNINGTVIVKMPTGQTELVTQAVEGLGSLEQGSDQLTVAANQAFVTGAILLKLGTGAAWSFR
jgi:hypothetical protein